MTTVPRPARLDDPSMCPDCHRDSCEQHGVSDDPAVLEFPLGENVTRQRSPKPDDVPVAEAFTAFDARLRHRDVPDDIISKLIPGQGITLFHGQPRALKSWVAEDIGLSAALGVAAFGLERFRPARVTRTWFITEEDAAAEVHRRFRCLLAGRSLPVHDLPLLISAGKGIDLDNARWQSEVIDIAVRDEVGLTIIDPLRSVTLAVDQGPRDLAPFARFCRRFIRETGSTLLCVHHDVKPAAGKADDRARPHRASGGGIFSIADAPIHCESLAASLALVTPSHFKFSIAPAPFTVRLETDDAQRPTVARLVGADATGATGGTADVDLRGRLIAFLTAHPQSTGSSIARGVHCAKAATLTTLDALRSEGLIDSVQRGQARLWALTATESQS